MAESLLGKGLGGVSKGSEPLNVYMATLAFTFVLPFLLAFGQALDLSLPLGVTENRSNDHVESLPPVCLHVPGAYHVSRDRAVLGI